MNNATPSTFPAQQRPPRILFLMRGSVHTHFGGAELQVDHLSRLCAAAGMDVHHAFDARPGTSLPDPAPVSLHPLPDRGGEARAVWNAAAIRRVLREVRPDVLYQRGRSAYTGLAARSAAALGIPLVFNLATDNDARLNRPRPGRMLFYTLCHEWLGRYGVRHAHTLVAQTRFQQTLLRMNFHRDSRVLPSLAEVPPPPPPKPEPPLVLWMANLKLKKQPQLFVELAARCSDLDARFVLAGRRPTKPALVAALERARTLPNVTDLGELPFAQTHDWFARAALFVNTSLPNEGYPNTYMQAWMSETPVVTLHCDPDDTLVREGIGRHSGSLDRLVADVRELYAAPALRAEMGRRARDYAIRTHAMDHVGPLYLELFRSLAASASGEGRA